MRNPGMQRRKRACQRWVAKRRQPIGGPGWEVFDVFPHRLHEQQFRQSCQHVLRPGLVRDMRACREAERAFHPFRTGAATYVGHQQVGKRIEQRMGLHGSTQVTAYKAAYDAVAAARVDLRQLVMAGFADQRLGVHRRQGEIAAEQVHVVAHDHDQVPSAANTWHRVADTDLHMAVQHVVERHQARSRRVGRAIFLGDLRVDAPRRAESGVEEHPAGEAKHSQEVRQGIHGGKPAPGGGKAKGSGGTAIPRIGRRRESVVHAGRSGSLREEDS